jgi:AraC-like DNA-binding protein
VIQRKGDSGLVYCTIQPMDIFKNKMLTGQWGIFALLVLCSIPAALIIAVLSKNVFGKVRNINALLTEDNDYNLDTVEKGIRSLVESRQEQERESIPLRKSRFVENLVKGEFEDRTAALKAAGGAKLNVSMPYYVVVLMGDRGNANERKAHEMMLEVIDNETLIDGYGIKLLNQNQSLFVLFGEDKKVLDIISRFFLQIGKDYCEDFVLAVSGFHEDITEASKAYLEANSAYDSRLLMDNGNVIRFEELPDTEQESSLSEVYLQQLKNAIYMGDEEGMRKVVAEICEQMRNTNQSLLKFRLFYNDVIQLLMREWHMKESEIGEIYNVFTLSKCLTLQDFNDILCQVCEKLLHKASEKAGRRSDLAAAAAEYMQEHYMEYELNMSSLAEYLKVTPATLTVEFKNGLGMNPSDYLAGIRLERAKSLLLETDLLVREISQAVGYEDEHMFMRRFKKYTGKTPGQYREEHAGSEGNADENSISLTMRL